jgi:hypothetical protein
VKKLSEVKGYGDASFVLSLLGGIFVIGQSILMITFALFFGAFWGFMMPMGGMMWSPGMYEHMAEEHGTEVVNDGFYSQGIWGIDPLSFIVSVGVIALILGAVILYSAITIKNADVRTGGILALVVGAISLFFGMWLGALFAILGGIFALVD